MRKIYRIIINLLAFCLIFSLSCYMQDKKLTYSDSYIQFWFTDTPSTFTRPGEKFQIKYSLQPVDSEIHWSTDDESVAAVDEYGIATAMGPGRCSITATVGDMTKDGQVWDRYTTSTIEVICNFD